MNAAARTLFAAAFVVAACDPSADVAVDPAWNRQSCAHCGMVVGEPRFAAEAIRSTGARVFFDDVGCMIAFAHEQSVPLRHAWVHDGHRWIDARTARFHEEVVTPMGFGLVTSAEGSEGLSYGDAEARVLAKIGAPR